MTYRKLGLRTKEQRRALLANQAKAVILNEKIKTTEARAKEVRKQVDYLVSLGKKGTLEARRDALAFVHNDKKIVDKVFTDLAKRYEERKGGYTRISKLEERKGDNALVVLLELV